jgi:hypothetical protein
MSTIDRDRMALVGRVCEVVVILIVVGSVAQDLETVNSLDTVSFCDTPASIRPMPVSMLWPWLARTSA